MIGYLENPFDHNLECIYCDGFIEHEDNCPWLAFRRKRMEDPFMTYAATNEAITCLLCGRTSHHPKDISERYCGNCHMFHEAVIAARKEFAKGATHECNEWCTALNYCAVCGRSLQ